MCIVIKEAEVQQAAIQLKELGFTKIYDMDGGILLWEENKLEFSN